MAAPDATAARRTDRPWSGGCPACALARTYDRSWLRSDVIAGIVLAAILVPQGMAYAELAGLPAVTGLYTTIACLLGYALFGPSRVLVLGPDSSISPLILAAITPLLAPAGTPEPRSRWPGCSPILVGLVEIGLGLGKLGFVADLLSKEVQVGYMNGLAVTIIVGQLPKLFGFSTDADGFLDEVKAFVEGIDQTNTTTLLVGLSVLAVLLVLPRATTRLPAILVAVVGATVALGGARTCRTRASRRSARCPQGVPSPEHPLDPGERRRAAAHRGVRHHARLADRHDRHRDELRGAARRRGRARPGDGRASAPRTSPPVSSRGSPSPRAAHARRSPSSPGAKSQAHGRRRRGARRGAAPVPDLAARRPPADRARGGRHRRRALAHGPQAPRQRLAACAAAPWPSRSSPAPGSSSSASCRASSSPSHWRSCCSSGATGGRTARCSGRSTDLEGWHSVDDYPERRRATRDRRLPLGGAAVLRQRGHLPPAGPAPGARPAARLGRPAVRGHHRRRPDGGRRCSSSSTTSSTPPGSTSPSPSCAGACRTSRCATGCGRPSTTITSTRRSRRR